MKPTLLLLVAMGSCCGWGLWSMAAADPATAGPPDATAAPPPSAEPQLSAAELEKLVMPIALHPDPLIAILLPASVYPVEVVQAARFVKDTNNIPLVDQQPWDESVKAVAKFPDLIAKMDADLAWTAQLGQAFLAQPEDLMNAIQALRAKAQKAGTLQTTPQQIVSVTNTVVEKTVEQQVVVVTNTIVQIQPSNPQIIYVPSYTTTVYYPPPAYVYDPYAPLVTFGVGMAVGAIIANNHCDWHHGGVYCGGGGNFYNRNVNVDIDRNRNVNRGDRVSNRPDRADARPEQRKWQPDQSRLRTSGAPPSAQTREARGWGSAGTQPAQRLGSGGAGARPSQLPSAGAGAARPAQRSTSNWSQRPTAGAQPARSPSAGSAQSRSVSRPSPQRSSAFSGVSSGSSARSFSNRGAASRGGGGFGGGGRGGGGRGGGRR